MSAPLPVEAQLQELLKEAMRAKDARTADCIRMIKTKHMERRTAAGFKGPLDDALWLDVIGAYQKQLRKSREEYVAIGARGAEAIPHAKQAGRVVGDVMKAHKGKLEAAAVKRIVDEELAPKS